MKKKVNETETNTDMTEENNKEQEEIQQAEMSEEQTAEKIEENEPEKESTEQNEWKEKYEELNNTYLRKLAEYENYRKRTTREKAELVKSAGEGILKDILPLVDDFERGIAAAENTDDIAAVKEGVKLIYDKFVKFLEQNGVKEIEAQNQPFDTDYHEAITMIPATEEEQKGKVIDCVQKGYTLNEKVIRYAKVVVAQ